MVRTHKHTQVYNALSLIHIRCTFALSLTQISSKLTLRHISHSRTPTPDTHTHTFTHTHTQLPSPLATQSCSLLSDGLLAINRSAEEQINEHMNFSPNMLWKIYTSLFVRPAVGQYDADDGFCRKSTPLLCPKSLFFSKPNPQKTCLCSVL